MWSHNVSCSPPFVKTLASFSYKFFCKLHLLQIFPVLSLLYSLLVFNIGAVNQFTTYGKMSLLSLIIEQSTVPCLITIP